MTGTAKAGDSLFYLLFDESIDAGDAESWLSKDSSRNYSALWKSMTSANRSGAGKRIKTCSLVRMSSGQDDVWPNLYAVRLIYS